MKRIVLTIDGMHCDGCRNAVRDAVLSVDPEAEVDVSLAERQVIAETGAEPEKLVDAITRLGYGVEAARSNL